MHHVEALGSIPNAWQWSLCQQCNSVAFNPAWAVDRKLTLFSFMNSDSAQCEAEAKAGLMETQDGAGEDPN